MNIKGKPVKHTPETDEAIKILFERLLQRLTPEQQVEARRIAATPPRVVAKREVRIVQR